MLEWFFSDSVACTITQKKTKIPRRNLLTTKERQKSEKIIPYTLLLLFACMITLEMFLFLSPSLHLELQTRLLCYCQDILTMTSYRQRTKWRKSFWLINLFQKYGNSILIISFTPLSNWFDQKGNKLFPSHGNSQCFIQLFHSGRLSKNFLRDELLSRLLYWYFQNICLL
jgi:hypothetical protein